MIDSGSTSHLHIEFFVEAEENPGKSRKEGRPIFEDKEFVRIKFVGDPKKELVAPAHDKFMKDGQTGDWVTYAQAYHRHYEAFKTGEAAKGEGTPISELHFITASRRAELKALHVHTVEGLAGLEGANLARLGMYGRQLKEQATDYIARSKETALETRLSAENVLLKARLEALEAAMAGKPFAQEPEPTTASNQFDGFTDADLKAFIKERTNSAPKGQPSRSTLLQMAEKAAAEPAEAA